MKKIFIVAFVMIAAAIALLFKSADDLTTYTTFEDARNTGKKVKVVGQLSKDREMVFDPAKDPNYFTFFISDTEGEERKVILYASKPQDFEKSEQIVVTGEMQGDEFLASDLLMKCPSKYKDEEVYIKSTKKS